MRSQGGARSSLALSWLVEGLWPARVGLYPRGGARAQVESGNFHLTKRKTDGAEIFTIKKQRWVEYWLQQPHPVMLVIGTFSDDDERAIGKDKLEFAEVRWMEISSVLQRESANGTKPVKQIVFKGERLDLSSVRRWREKVLAEKAK